jgi:hypothetical protein
MGRPVPDNLLFRLRRFPEQYRTVYKPSGGPAALARCYLDPVRARATAAVRRGGERPDGITVATFSVLPRVTYLWQRCAELALVGPSDRIVLCDSSGGIAPSVFGAGTSVLHFPNVMHGTKIDFIIRHLARTPYVLLSDDDIFWRDRAPIDDALELMRADDRLAAVSMLPRPGQTIRVGDLVQPTMGAYALLVRRDVILREGLTFKVVYRPFPESEQGLKFYDAGDLAHVELLRRGYRVAIAEEQAAPHMAALHSVSLGTLRIRKRAFNDRHIEYRAARTLRALDDLFDEQFPGVPLPRLLAPEQTAPIIERYEATHPERAPEIAAEVTAELAEVSALVRERAAGIGVA